MVTFVAPAFEYYPILANSLICQTHQDWNLVCIHDGPNEQYKEWFASIGDPRIELYFTPVRYNNWGHSLRAWAIEELIPKTAEYVCFSNMDNYYVPTFLKEMLAAAEGHAGAYCDMLHSHHAYRLLPARLECNHIDCGALLVEAELAAATPWTSRRFAADWDWIADLLQQTTDFVHVPLPLFVHC